MEEAYNGAVNASSPSTQPEQDESYRGIIESSSELDKEAKFIDRFAQEQPEDLDGNAQQESLDEGLDLNEEEDQEPLEEGVEHQQLLSPGTRDGNPSTTSSQSTNAASSTIYSPQAPTKEDLSSVPGATLGLSPYGMSTVLEEQLRSLTVGKLDPEAARKESLARTFLRGGFVRFRSPAEKEEVLAYARKEAGRLAVARSEQKGEEVEGPVDVAFETLGEGEKGTLVGRLVGGRYDDEAEAMAMPDGGGEGVMQTVMKKLMLNGTYLKTDQDAFKGKVQSLLRSYNKRLSQQQRLGRENQNMQP